jgi:hypothetical protein
MIYLILFSFNLIRSLRARGGATEEQQPLRRDDSEIIFLIERKE